MASFLAYLESPAPSFLFDLDGTLIDSVYQHVIAWRTALRGSASTCRCGGSTGASG